MLQGILKVIVMIKGFSCSVFFDLRIKVQNESEEGSCLAGSGKIATGSKAGRARRSVRLNLGSVAVLSVL